MIRLRFAPAARIVFCALAVWSVACRSLEPVIDRMLEDCDESHPSALAVIGTGDAPTNPEPASEMEQHNGCAGVDCIAIAQAPVDVALLRTPPVGSVAPIPQMPADADPQSLMRPPIARA